jgi:hypothetical protein
MTKTFIPLLLILTTISCGPSKEEIEAKLEQETVSKIKTALWSGEIVRVSDNLKLSDAKMRISNDTLFMYSNALFGADNDTLKINSINLKDSTISLLSKSVNLTFNMDFIYNDKSKTISLINPDFQVMLKQTLSNVFTIEDFSFYKNISVPTNPAYYLDGAYKGKLEMEDALTNMFLQTSMKGYDIKLTFLENFKVKQSGSGLLSSSTQVNDYYIKADKLYIKEGKKEDLYYTIKKNGEKLVFENDKLNIVLNKVY